MQRYHQAFMPALRLVNGILATLGQFHAAAKNQALEFLVQHRDTLVILLKSGDFDSLAIIDEVRLVVHMCAEIFPRVPKEELVCHRLLH
jgi:nuclear pore complex protein Nup205